NIIGDKINFTIIVIRKMAQPAVSPQDAIILYIGMKNQRFMVPMKDQPNGKISSKFLSYSFRSFRSKGRKYHLKFWFSSLPAISTFPEKLNFFKYSPSSTVS